MSIYTDNDEEIRLEKRYKTMLVIQWFTRMNSLITVQVQSIFNVIMQWVLAALHSISRDIHLKYAILTNTLMEV